MNYIDLNTIEASYSDAMGGEISVVLGKNFNFRNPDLDPCIFDLGNGGKALVVDYAEGTENGFAVTQLALHSSFTEEQEDFVDGLPFILLILVNGEGRVYQLITEDS